jgi:hypothetical protein
MVPAADRVGQARLGMGLGLNARKAGLLAGLLLATAGVALGLAALLLAEGLAIALAGLALGAGLAAAGLSLLRRAAGAVEGWGVRIAPAPALAALDAAWRARTVSGAAIDNAGYDALVAYFAAGVSRPTARPAQHWSPIPACRARGA